MVHFNQGVIWGLPGGMTQNLVEITSVQPGHSFGSWLLSDCTYVYVAVEAAVSLSWDALVLRAYES